MTDADVVVIGAGLGGLSAAVHLARAGAKVLVLERGHEPGGFATTYRRGPFRFEASLHLMDSVGPGEPNRRLIEGLGLDTDVRWTRAPIVRRELWVDRGWDLRLPQGLPGAVDAWAEHLPDDREGIAAFFAAAERLRRVADEHLESGEGAPDADQIELLRLLGCTADDLLRRYVSPRAADAMCTLTSYLGLGGHEMAALPFLVMMDGYHRAGSWYVDGGSRSVTEALVGRIRAAGGEVVCDAAVTGLTARRNRVVSATLADGRTFTADSFVSAISPLWLAQWLPQALPARYVERLSSLRLSRSLVRLSLGLDVDPREAWGTEYETWLVNAVDAGGAFVNRTPITAPVALDPGCAPAGCGILSITTIAEHAEGGWSAERKLAEQARLSEVAERYLFPGLSRHTVLTDFSHPGTYERFAAVPKGAVFGFDAGPDQSAARRLGARTPLANLLLAGGWVFPGAGQVAALWSGRIAARHVLHGAL